MLRVALRRNYSKFSPRFYATINKVLIANRGEIACRVIRTAKKLGIKTVAVFSEADANAMHVSLADEAYCIGPPESKNSYLCGDKIISVAKKTGANAIHPGYGFLSENEAFANSVTESNLIFIGPPGTAIRDMGSKSASKNIMTKAKVPVIPGYHGEDQSDHRLAQEAASMGYPVLLKAVHGGGGKGMQIVHNAGELSGALASCRRVAESAFGKSDVLIEKYITRSRHIEVQIFADSHGNVVYLHERDCSVQRRHQKIIEEAPAPGITPEIRKQMGETAANAARAVGYLGAGTVEFIFDLDGDGGKGKFYFMEMNTRLQVEHPVTEMITRQDLVHWQFQVAEGKPLPLTQEKIPLVGHAFEARIYAENPDKGFLPGSGTLECLIPPTVPIGAEDNIRVDTGVRQGDLVSIFYDPMIAKLVVWDSNRELALRRLIATLEQYSIAGLHTNIDFLIRLASHKEFQLGKVHTGFIDIHNDELGLSSDSQNKPPPPFILAMAKLAQVLQAEQEQEILTQNSLDPFSPWGNANFRRFNHTESSESEYLVHETVEKVNVTLIPPPFGKKSRIYSIDVSKKNLITKFENVSGTFKDGILKAVIGGVYYTACVFNSKNGEIEVIYKGKTYNIIPHIPVQMLFSSVKEGSLCAKTHGQVIKIFVEPGQQVQVGDPLVVMEAMKLETTITSPETGEVENVYYRVGDKVEEKAELVSLKKKV